MKYLYRLYDSDRVLLYVGHTTDPFRRLGEHQKIQPWAADIAHMESEPIDGDPAVAEMNAIRAGRPKYNRNLNATGPQRTPPPDADLLSTAEVATLLGVSVPTVARLCRSGRLPLGYKAPGLRGARLFDRDDVVRLMAGAA